MLSSFPGTLLTAALLMRAIDRKTYHEESLQFIDTLKQCDPLRRGYYVDLSNKWCIEDRLADWVASLEENKSNKLDLSSLGLCDVHYRQYFCAADEVDLSGNNFEPKRLQSVETFLVNSKVKLIV